MNFGELIAKGGALFARKGADALADTLETAPPADLARIQSSVSGVSSDTGNLLVLGADGKPKATAENITPDAVGSLAKPGGVMGTLWIDFGYTNPAVEDAAYKVAVVDFGVSSGQIRLAADLFFYDENTNGRIVASCYKFPKGAYDYPNGMYAPTISGSVQSPDASKGIKLYWAVKDIDATTSKLVLVIEQRTSRHHENKLVGISTHTSASFEMATSMAAAGLYSSVMLLKTGEGW